MLIQDEDGEECVNCVLFFFLPLSEALHKVNMVLLAISFTASWPQYFYLLGGPNNVFCVSECGRERI